MGRHFAFQNTTSYDKVTKIRKLPKQRWLKLRPIVTFTKSLPVTKVTASYGMLLAVRQSVCKRTGPCDVRRSWWLNFLAGDSQQPSFNHLEFRKVHQTLKHKQGCCSLLWCSWCIRILKYGQVAEGIKRFLLIATASITNRVVVDKSRSSAIMITYN